MSMLVDSHCHLDMLDLANFDHQFDNILTQAKQQNVNHFLCVCVTLDAFPKMLELIEPYDSIDASVGLHPNEQVTNEPTIDELTQLASHKKIVAIGETGLDYYRSEGDVTWQQQRFRTHIQAAKQVNKPLIIHTRQAKQDTIAIMQEQKANEVGGVMHCFTEDWQMAKQALDMGFYISISGIVTFKNATVVQDVAKRIPLDRLLVETDSPYLAPVPYRGKPNQPAYVHYVANTIAELRKMTLDKLTEITTNNYFKLFKPEDDNGRS